jgi:hypothetical protein
MRQTPSTGRRFAPFQDSGSLTHMAPFLFKRKFARPKRSLRPSEPPAMQTPPSPRGIDQWQEARDHAMELLCHQKEHAEQRVLELLKDDMALVIEKNAQRHEIHRLEVDLNTYMKRAHMAREANERLGQQLMRQEEESERRVAQLESEKRKLQHQLDALLQQHQQRDQQAEGPTAVRKPFRDAAMATKKLPVTVTVALAAAAHPQLVLATASTSQATQLSTNAVGSRKRRRQTGIEADTRPLAEDDHDVKGTALPQPPQQTQQQSRPVTRTAQPPKPKAARKLFEDDEPERKKARCTRETFGDTLDTTSQESDAAETEAAAAAEVAQIPAISLKRRRSVDDQTTPLVTVKRLRSFSTLMQCR